MAIFDQGNQIMAVNGVGAAPSNPNPGQVLGFYNTSDGKYHIIDSTGADVIAAGSGGAVTSVFTRTGAVVATSGDYSVAQVTGAAPLASPSFTGSVASAGTVRIASAASGDLGIIQTANGTDAIYAHRNTDTSPTGNFIHFQKADATTDTWVVDANGKFAKYVNGAGTGTGLTTSGNGITAMFGGVNQISKTANIVTTNIINANQLGNGLIRINYYLELTTAGTTSTLPSLVLGWTARDSTVAMTQTFASSTPTTNTVGTTFFSGSLVISQLTSAAVTYQTTSYASTGTAMQYALRIQTEYLGT